MVRGGAVVACNNFKLLLRQGGGEVAADENSGKLIRDLRGFLCLRRSSKTIFGNLWIS